MLPLIKNIALLCNPFAGSGRSLLLTDKIIKTLDEKGVFYSLFIESWPETLAAFTDVWIIGGDGTLNYFINRYTGIKADLVIFKGGTGNDVHWLLYRNKSMEEVIELGLNALPRPVDMGKCNDKYFINGVGIGFEGAVAKSLIGKKKRPGKTSFLIVILKKIFSYRSSSYKTEAVELRSEGKKLMIDVANGQRAGGGFHIAPESAIDDGLLDVILVDHLPPLRRLWYLPIIEKGKHLNYSFINHIKTRKIIIQGQGMIQAHLDGEYYEAANIEIEIIPGALRFRY